MHDSLQAILDTLNDPARAFESLQALEREVLEHARAHRVEPADALDHVLTAWERDLGFAEPLDLEPRIYLPEELQSTIRGGAHFRDPFFFDDVHGVQTHRIQWNVLARSWTGPMPLPDVYRQLGEPGLTYWDPLFDGVIFDSFSNPHFLSAPAFRELLPGLGAWR